MKTKKCSKCKEIKTIGEFNKDRQKKDGLSYCCKECKKIKSRKWYLNNAEAIREYSKEYRKNNLEKVKELIRKCTKEWQKNNIEYRKKYAKQYYRDNLENEKKRHKRFIANNPNYYKEYNKKWRVNNPEYDKEWCRDRREKDPTFRLSKNISRMIRKSIHNNKDGYHWENLLGYSLRDLMAHLESKFENDMTWQNMGEWHIDHIKPISSFSFISCKDKEFKECWSLNNLQPLWAVENIKKGNRLVV